MEWIDAVCDFMTCFGAQLMFPGVNHEKREPDGAPFQICALVRYSELSELVATCGSHGKGGGLMRLPQFGVLFIIKTFTAAAANANAPKGAT